MWARGRFDIGWSDLAFGALRCAWPSRPDRIQSRVERLWSPAGDVLVCASVRSGFDLLLRSLALPPGSEVLFSALNVKGMIRIVEGRGLVPVPVDLDPEELSPRVDRLEQAITERSRVLVVAHLFGARLDLGPVLAIARRRGLFVVEDCAQGFERVGDPGGPGVDACFFSFGPLKSATAVGGALARIADPALLQRMRHAQSEHPLQTRRSYLLRLARFAGLKLLTYRPCSGLLSRLVRADLDRHLEAAARRITRERNPARPGRREHALRTRPCTAMLSLLERRLRRAPERAIEARRQAGRALHSALAGAIVCPGAKNLRHSFWLFPVLAKDPKRLVETLRASGFDAAPIASLRLVPAPAQRPELEPAAARDLLSHIVILPCYAAMGKSALARQAALLRREY